MGIVKLYFLGPPRIERDDQILEVDTRKAAALLAYLALSGERPSRDWLAFFLWPEFDDSRAKAALRRTLSALKTAVGEGVLHATRDAIGLETAAFWCDATAFRQLLRAGELAAATALYRADFLTGFSLRDSLPFDDWQLQQAEDLRRDLAHALEQLVQQAILRRDFEAGLEYGRRWLQIDPLREEAHAQLMHLYAWAGQRSAALRQYRDCVRILDEELGVPPLPETTALYHDIQDDKLTRQPGAPSRSLAPLPLRPLAPSPPLIGRTAELAQMQQLYRQVGPDGRLLIIEGEPGIGKTRLAAALLDAAAANGAPILTGRGYAGETSLAYAPLIQALQAGLARMDAAWLDGLPSHHLAEAARLLPELASGRALSPLADLDAPGAQVRFYAGVAHLLTALLNGDGPGILWLDDAHWLDAASQELLLFLLHRWRERPLLILLCWRAEELPLDSPLSPLAATLRRAGVSAAIRPARFSAAEVAELLAASGLAYPPDLPARLYAETEGLPFFVVEYLHALEAHGAAPTAGALPPTPASVRDLLHQRLRQIGETERQIVQTAAAIGHSFDLGLVQDASGRSAEETVTALELLTARGLLAEQTAAYDFSHDKLRALVYEEMGLARRRLLHRRLAETLANRRATPTTAGAAQIAAHYQLAGLEAEAAAYFVQAGDQARALYAHQDAIHAYRAALALGADDAWRLHAAIGELATRLGTYPDALASYETAAALAPAAELGHLEHQLAKIYQRQGEWSLADHTLAQAQRRLGPTADPAALARLTIDRSLVAHRRQQPQAALALAEQARALAEAAGDEAALALAFNLLGLLARSGGDLETAVALLEHSRELADGSDRLDIRIAARNNLALALGVAGQWDAARANLAQALALCQRLGDRHHEAALRSNLADVLHQMGDDAAAQAQIRQSVTIYAEIGREEETWRAEIWQLTAW
jgi:DNA-binding SARP family transcriptional activator/predicted ATPase